MVSEFSSWLVTGVTSRAPFSLQIEAYIHGAVGSFVPRGFIRSRHSHVASGTGEGWRNTLCTEMSYLV